MQAEAEADRAGASRLFKVGAVRLVLDEGKTISQVARDLDVVRGSLELWVAVEPITGWSVHSRPPSRACYLTAWKTYAGGGKCTAYLLWFAFTSPRRLAKTAPLTLAHEAFFNGP